jgi:xylulose-5-phosphate/fructose-6-phosphate phosphoketolase
MTVMNELDRFDLVMDVIDRVPRLGHRAGYVRQAMRDRLIEHWNFTVSHGQDMAAISDWVWPY